MNKTEVHPAKLSFVRDSSKNCCQEYYYVHPNKPTWCSSKMEYDTPAGGIWFSKDTNQYVYSNCLHKFTLEELKEMCTFIERLEGQKLVPKVLKGQGIDPSYHPNSARK